MRDLEFPRHAVSRAKTARRTGRWPAWERTEVPPGSAGGNGWMREITHAYHNTVFAVLCRPVETPFGPSIHAAIRDVANSRDFTWAEKQRIKDECFGADRTAIEVYPTADDLVVEADIYHLWVLPAGVSLPFGLHVRAA